MAMAFAPLAVKMKVTLDNPAVVRKSYPGYWNDLKRFGFEMRCLKIQKNNAQSTQRKDPLYKTLWPCTYFLFNLERLTYFVG